MSLAALGIRAQLHGFVPAGKLSGGRLWRQRQLGKCTAVCR